MIDEEWRKSEKLAPTGEVFAVIQDLDLAEEGKGILWRLRVAAAQSLPIGLECRNKERQIYKKKSIHRRQMAAISGISKQQQQLLYYQLYMWEKLVVFVLWHNSLLLLLVVTLQFANIIADSLQIIGKLLNLAKIFCLLFTSKTASTRVDIR